jgi:2-furoyl-CoA dehydrogenase large subunit
MSATPFRFVSTDRRVREDRRFVVGKGRFAADVAMAGTRHVAVVTCPHPAARIIAIDKAEALAMPGVHYVLDGRELAAATQPLLAGLDTPKVPRRPLAVDVARYSGEWVAAVVADTRALAEDAAELVRVDYEPLPFVLDGEAAYAPGSPVVHADHGSNVLLDRTFVWGEVEQDFADSPHRLSVRVTWGRSSTVPVETFGVLASWDPWREVLDVFASVQMPRFPDQVALALKLPGSSVRVYNDVDVGGSYGVKRGIKHAVLVGYLSRRRRPWTRAQLRPRGRLRRRRRDPVDEDARARQCRRLRRALAVPARQARQRNRRAVPHQERAVSRHRGDVEQDRAGGGACIRPGADQLRHRARARGGRLASRARSA